MRALIMPVARLSAKAETERGKPAITVNKNEFIILVTRLSKRL